MENNCYTKEYKGAVEKDSLEYFGYIKAIVDTTGMQSNFTPYLIDVETGGITQRVAGVKILDGKTFANGKTETEAGDKVEFVADDTYKVLFPKYVFPIVAPSLDINEGNGHISYNLSDYDYIEFTHQQANNSWVAAFNFEQTAGSKKVSGSLENFADWMNPAVVGGIRLSNSDISVNLGDTKLSGLYKLGNLYINSTTNVTGSIIDFIDSMAVKNASQLKQRTNNLIIRIQNTSADVGVFSNSQAYSVQMHFTGSSAITITNNNIIGTVIKTWNYDIDTQTLSEA